MSSNSSHDPYDDERQFDRRQADNPRMLGRSPIDRRSSVDTGAGSRTSNQSFLESTPEFGEPLTWRDDAACRERPDVDFFPYPEDVQAISRAKEVCAIRPVNEECLIYAISTRQGDGLWGGHTTKERAKLRRKWMEDVRSPAATNDREVASSREAS